MVNAMKHATIAEIDHNALRHNFNLITERTGRPVIAVVKADAYGHGAVPVARTLCDAGARWLAVATPNEALELRDAGIDHPVLLFGAHHPSYFPDLINRDILLTVHDSNSLRAISRAARQIETRAHVHLCIDSGMHRAGVLSAAALSLLDEAARTEAVSVSGLYTHFSSADEEDPAYTHKQLALFRPVEKAARQRFPDLHVHMANSAAVMRFPQSHADAVRPGIMLYGNLPAPDFATDWPLREAMTLKSNVGLIKKVPADSAVSYNRRYTTTRPTRLAVVPAGYADGMPRAMTGQAQVLINGCRFPVAGTITMDQIIVDVGNAPVREGDEVVFFGAQGKAFLSINEWAKWAGTISYEITCGISRRVKRRHHL
ncbi:MAG: alanine racemase [Calditrichaeota bacterium]|nr:MAG: alanine racemase [Calditrichota bacterium]